MVELVGLRRKCAIVLRCIAVLCLLVGFVPTGFALPPPAAIEGTTVRFPSANPFTLADAGSDPPPIDAIGQLFLPPGSSGPVPAVVLLHGAGGVGWARELTYARQLAANGWAALVVDVFGARVEPGTGFTARLLNVTEAMFLADAYAALRFLDAHPAVDGDRVALVGFSYGGMVATYALHAQVQALYAKRRERFRAHAAFYAPCIASFANRRTTGAPFLMLYGTDDAIVDPARCEATLADLEVGGSATSLEVYAGAAHRWDSGPRNWQAPRGLARCRFRVAADGTVHDERTYLPLDGYLARALALAWCADDDGYRIRGDAAIKARSDARLEAFLEAAFAEEAPWSG